MIENLDIGAVIQRSYLSGLSQKVSADACELDFAIWCSLRRLANEQPDLATKQFRIKPETAQYIAQTDKQKLKKLTSRAVISFKINNPEKEIIDYLINHDQKDLPKIPNSAVKLNKKYWIILYHAVNCHLYAAHLRFGISLDLAKTLLQADIKKISLLAQAIELQFSLRCKEEYILVALQENDFKDSFCKKLFSILTLANENA